MPIDRRMLQERVRALMAEALQEVLAENGAIKEAIKTAVKQAVIQRISQAAEHEAVAFVDEALGIKEVGFAAQQ